VHDAEWRSRLTPAQFAVLRQARTERPYTSPLNDEHRAAPSPAPAATAMLFSSTTKFDSRTGWPSFWAPMANAVGTERDTSYGMVRTAVHCARCGGHLGHLFDDGPGRPGCATA
jgi:peptide-methionine (R)-S-oxide reductase